MHGEVHIQQYSCTLASECSITVDLSMYEITEYPLSSLFLSSYFL